ncbi:Cytochrome bo(3) ubiquinol oxidase subunit 2 [invertebrate metagenome]|uniref:Ubiquinol oxidase polypeptide II n=1 Tax=invertebrate metagenome TaxID=1711999 RepID=A0A2H9T8D2_9ZZZZ
MLILSGCDSVLFHSKGFLGAQEGRLITWVVSLLLLIIIPALFMSVYFPWRYRYTNKKAEYLPEWEYSAKIECAVWLIPCLIIIVLALMATVTCFSLDPRKPLGEDKETLTIQVIAMDWKWLFIYPEQQVAVVNEVAFPVGVPLEFLVTSDTVMNSFFIPQLGSQIYAMAGMENRLHLMASEAGCFRGLSANYSGVGFSGMKFTAKALSGHDFERWLGQVRQSQRVMDDGSYGILSQRSKDHPVQYFADIDPLHFRKVIEKYTGEQNVY